MHKSYWNVICKCGEMTGSFYYMKNNGQNLVLCLQLHNWLLPLILILFCERRNTQSILITAYFCVILIESHYLLKYGCLLAMLLYNFLLWWYYAAYNLLSELRILWTCWWPCYEYLLPFRVLWMVTFVAFLTASLYSVK